MMRPYNNYVPAIALLALTAYAPMLHAGPGAHGPNGEHLDEPAAASALTLSRQPDGSVYVPKAAQRRMVIRTMIARQADHARTVELNARVTVDPNAGGQVQAPFAGRIESGKNGLPVIGQRVTKGQPMLQLRAVAGALERGNQQAQLADIRANLELARQRVERLQSLEGIVPQKEIQAARAELASLSGRQSAVAGSLGSSETIYAPATGIIASSRVLAGQIVDARDVLFEVIDPNRMMVEAMFTDASLAARIASATLAGIPGVELKLLGAGGSMREGALPMIFQAHVSNTRLAVGQPVTVVAKLTDTIKGIALPAEAVVRNPANEPIVWIKSGTERFIAQPVEIRPLDASTVVVVKGLSVDNRVVVSGTSLINQIR